MIKDIAVIFKNFVQNPVFFRIARKLTKFQNDHGTLKIKISQSCTLLIALVCKNVKTSNKNKIQSIDKNFSGLSTSLKGVTNYKL